MREMTLTKSPNKHQNISFATQVAEPDLSRVTKLTENNRAEVLAFLRIRPVHTVLMASFISDNGIEGRPKPRNVFRLSGRIRTARRCSSDRARDSDRGTADRAMAAFGLRAKIIGRAINLIMSEHEGALDFWDCYAPGTSPRLNFTELLFETTFPMLVRDCKYDVRPAAFDQLDQIAEAHAEVAFIESGHDPMVRDREGFLKRVARRIEMGRTFVVFEGDKLVFKADIIAEADGIVYLEGVWVATELRGKGIGSRCLSKLNLILMERADVICMLSNERFTGAHRSFERAGYRATGRCTTLFV